MHLWGAATQQVDQSRIERHDGVAHVNDFSSFLTRTATHSAVFHLTRSSFFLKSNNSGDKSGQQDAEL